MNPFLIAEVYGDCAYLWYGKSYLGNIVDWSWRELTSRGYLIVFK